MSYKFMITLILSAKLNFAQASEPPNAYNRKMSEFTPGSPASSGDWKFFFQANQQWRLKLWSHFFKENQGIEAWHWSWKIGWTKACLLDRHKFCPSLYKKLIYDRAEVVRSQVASHIGLYYEGSENKEFFTLLEKAYSNPKNFRKNRPLPICKRILFAMHQIMGAKGRPAIEKLAQKSPETKEYTAKLLGASQKVVF